MKKLATNRLLKYLQTQPFDKVKKIVTKLKLSGNLPEGKYIKNLGEGAEGTADLITSGMKGNTGMVVKKYYNPDAKLFSKEEFKRKVDTFEALKGNPNIAEFYGAEKNKPIHYTEYIDGSLSKNRVTTHKTYEETIKNIETSEKAIKNIQDTLALKKKQTINDVSPYSNILTNNKNTPKIIDFRVPTTTYKKRMADTARQLLKSTTEPVKKELIKAKYTNLVNPGKLPDDEYENIVAKLSKSSKDPYDTILFRHNISLMYDSPFEFKTIGQPNVVRKKAINYKL